MTTNKVKSLTSQKSAALNIVLKQVSLLKVYHSPSIFNQMNLFTEYNSIEN